MPDPMTDAAGAAPAPQTGAPAAPVSVPTPDAVAPAPVDTAAAAPSVDAVSAADGVPTPADAPTEAAPADPAAIPDDKPSLLGGDVEAKAPEGAAPTDGEAQEAGTDPAAEAPKPVYEAFKLPDGVAPDNERMSAFTDLIGEARLTQEQGQKLVDLYSEEIARFHERAAEEQHRVFDEARAAWREGVTKDPELGGNRLNTTLSAIKSLRDRFASDEAHLREFARVLDFTGAGDHPAVIRWFHNAAQGLKALYREPGPVPASRPAPALSRYERRYTATKKE